MNSPKDKQKKKDLGIFYTPREVVDFIFSILNILKQKEDKETQRWQSRKPKPHYPSVIDPACGEGIFLKKAIESGFTGYHPTYKSPYIFGVDIDEDVVKDWEKLSILSLFHNNKKMMNKHFFGQNGLLELPDHKLPYKKSEDGLFRFDAVVGNPPYGGIGVDFKKEKTKEAIKLLETLKNFEIFGFKKVKHYKEKMSIDLGGRKHHEITLFDQISLSDSIKIKKNKKENYKISISEVANIAQGMPIEILFVERFIQLAKPGGWIAIIIPDGILANSQLHYVREFIAKKTKVLGIVSLPRDTFKKVGTGAKTSILFLQKYKEKDKIDIDYPVFLASIKKAEKKYFDKISDAFKNFYYEKF